MRIKVYDKQGFLDRYSVLIDHEGEVYAWGLSINCNMPNGVCMSILLMENYVKKFLGKKVSIKSLPVEVRNKIKELKAIIIAERREV